MTRYYTLQSHQNKADAFVKALSRYGWEPTNDKHRAEFLFIDAEVNGRQDKIEEYYHRGKPAFVYPHAARPDLICDFPDCEPSKYLAAHFVVSPGHEEVMRAFGYPNPLISIGWSYCPIRPFKPRKEVKNVLFAPIHSSPGGLLSDIDRAINRMTYYRLRYLSVRGKIKLTVRHLYQLQQCGLPKEYSFVHYVKGNPDLCYDQIDDADVVVSHQTFLHLAVARGVPAVAMGEWYPPRYTLASGRSTQAKSWDKYKDLLMYPLDILAENTDTMDVLEQAIKSDHMIADWRRRMIGGPFCEDEFVVHINKVVNHHPDIIGG